MFKVEEAAPEINRRNYTSLFHYNHATSGSENCFGVSEGATGGN